MFTGLIESLGRVVDVSDAPAGKRLLVKPETTTDLTLGESVAVNGVCLTAVEQRLRVMDKMQADSVTAPCARLCGSSG